VYAGLLSGLLLAAPDAEARFGKRSSSSSSKSESKSSSKSQVHEATAVGDEDSGGDDDDSRSSSRSNRRTRGHRSHSLWDVFFGVAVNTSATTTTYVAPEPAVEFRKYPQPERKRLFVQMGANGGAMGGGGALGLFLNFEGRRWGFSTHYTGLGLPTEDGLPGTDRIHLMDAHLTFSPVSNPRGRWRLELGVSSASAPDITFVGPSFATSMELCLVGPLDFEVRLQAVPFPHRQLDAQAGLALHFGTFNLRGGWRGLVLDDAGHVDDVRHVDGFSGPYFGLGFAF